MLNITFSKDQALKALEARFPKIYAHYRAYFAVGIALILCCLFYWWHANTHPDTDDAYLQANLVSLAAQVTGPVSHVYVRNYQSVKAGEPLFDIDPQPFTLAALKAKAQLEMADQGYAAAQAAVKNAEAIVAERTAQLTAIQQHTARILELVARGQLSKDDGDNATGKLKAATATVQATQSQLQQARDTLGQLGTNNAKLRAAQTNLAQALLDLQHTHVIAPANGIISNFTLRTGTIVNANAPLFALIEDGHWWADANFKETVLARIQPGQPAKITVDIYPNHTFHGIVDNINPGSGASFSLLPPENATGNWIKVTQRFTVKVNIVDPDPRYPLRIGASCTVTINTTQNTMHHR